MSVNSVTFDRIWCMLQSVRDFINFSPVGYLHEYYGEIGPENAALLSFFVDAYAEFADDSMDIAEIGGGPTVYQLISMAPKAKSIIFTDYLSKNLNQVKLWVEAKKTAFDWDEYFEFAVKTEEKVADANKDKVGARKKLLRAKLNELIKLDIFNDKDLSIIKGSKDIVSMNFVAESITKDLEGVRNVIKRASSIIRPDGRIILTGLLCAEYWIEKNRKFPAAYVSEMHVKQILKELGFSVEIFKTVPAERRDDSDEYQGYHGIFMTSARLNA